MAKLYKVRVYYPEVVDTLETELSDKQYAELREAVDEARKEFMEEFPDDAGNNDAWNQWLESTLTDKYDFKITFWNGFIDREAKVLWIDLDNPTLDEEEQLSQDIMGRILPMMNEVTFNRYDPTGETNKSLWIINESNALIDKCIKEIISKENEDNFQLITIDAENIINRNLPNDLPIIQDGSHLLLGDDRIPTDLIEKYGYGILYIRNITKQTYEKFPQNLTYNLSKHHSLGRYLISPHWLIVCGVPCENFRLDIGGSYGLYKKNKS